MTQALINLVTNNEAPVNQYMTNPMSSATDTNTLNADDFEKALTIEDLKNKFASLAEDKDIADFRKILVEATGEANVETALDLTLARDINEIISQLQDSAEAAKTEIESITDSELENTCLDIDTELSDDSILNQTEETAEGVKTNLNDTTIIDTKEVAIQIKDTKNYTQEQQINVKNTTDTNNTEFSEVKNSKILDDIIKLTSDTITDNSAKTVEGTTDNVDLSIDEEALKDLNIESVKAETNSSGNSESFLTNESPEEHAVKVILDQDTKTFDLKLEAASNLQNTTAKTSDITTNKIIEQITKQMENLHHTSKLNIVMNPDKLGKVTIQLAKSAEGLSAQFTVASQEAREILTKGLNGLKDGLLTHGINIDNVSVKLSDTQKSEYKQDWTEQEGSKGGNKEQNKQEKEKDKGLFAKLMAQNESDENGKV